MVVAKKQDDGYKSDAHPPGMKMAFKILERMVNQNTYPPPHPSIPRLAPDPAGTRPGGTDSWQSLPALTGWHRPGGTDRVAPTGWHSLSGMSGCVAAAGCLGYATVGTGAGHRGRYDEISMDYTFWEDKSDAFKESEGSLLPLWKFYSEKAKRKHVTCITWSTQYNDMCIDMRLDACTDMCTDRCTDLCLDMCIDMCTDMCIDVCTDVFRCLHTHVCRHVMSMYYTGTMT